MAAPAWTAREWRPLARDLCAQVLDSERPVYAEEQSTSSVKHERRRQQRLLVRADTVVSKLYAHKYMDITPQQIKGEVDEIANKMEIHMLNARAQRLCELTRDCDYRVVKMLLELAEAPTQASDDRVAVDQAAPLEALQTWNRLLMPSIAVQKAEVKAREDAALAATMEAELLQVAWEDDWWKDREEDDGASDLDEALDDDLSSGSDGGDGVVRVIGSKVLYMDRRGGHSGKDVDMLKDNDDAVDGSTDGADEDEDVEDAMLLQYYSPTPRSKDHDEKVGTDDIEGVPFKYESGECKDSFETPSLLHRHVEAQIEYRLNHDPTCHAEHNHEPRRVVHERVFVEATFYVLRGVPSVLFDIRQGRAAFFNEDFFPSEFAASTLAQRGVTLSHLSPLTMMSVLNKIAGAASDLQFIRDIVQFLQASPSKSRQSLTAEGLAFELQRQIQFCERYIDETHSSMASLAEPHPKGLDDDERSKPKLLPTLLGAVGAFQEMFTMLSWLRSAVSNCINGFHSQSRQEIFAAQLSSQILSSLYRQLQSEYVESAASSHGGQRSRWNFCEILSQLFSGALVPYLDAVDQMLFLRGYEARVPLHDELFFVSAHGETSALLSPRSAVQKLVEETFEDAMSAQMPFRVDLSTVPSFLASLVSRMSAALESRQIMNQYLNHRAPQSTGDVSSWRLSAIFLAKFATAKSPSSNLTGSNPLGMTNFDEIIRQAVVQPIQAKCQTINGAIASMFREKLLFQEHVEVLRLYLLMHQQDVFTNLVQYLIEQMQLNPIGWAKSELINSAFQEAIQRLQMEGLITGAQRDIAARLSIRVDTKELDKLRVTRHIDITAIRHLQFKFTTALPLRVLFSGSVVHKYSTLATLLLQVKMVELTLTNFKQNYRHRLCFLQTQDTLRSQLVHLADMLHYTRAVLNYLANQMTGDAWEKVERVFDTSSSIREINSAHVEYLDKMLNSFFVLKKHEGFTRQFMQNFNDILAYGSRVDEFVRTVERNMSRFFDTIDAKLDKLSGKNSVQRGQGRLRRDLVPNNEFRVFYSKLVRQLRNPEGNYENQLHVIAIVLDAMVKNGASPHVNELLLLLTFNGFRSTTRTR